MYNFFSPSLIFKSMITDFNIPAWGGAARFSAVCGRAQKSRKDVIQLMPGLKNQNGGNYSGVVQQSYPQADTASPESGYTYASLLRRPFLIKHQLTLYTNRGEKNSIK